MAYMPGPGAKLEYTDPQEALGDPDLVEKPCCSGMVQLGREGTLVLGFTDNSIVDEEGPDFQVVGESARDDYLRVEVSADGTDWYAYPKVEETSGGLDLATVGLKQVVYIALTDLQPGTSTGAEVDAVVAWHSGPGPAVVLPTMAPPTPKPAAKPHPTMTATVRSLSREDFPEWCFAEEPAESDLKAHFEWEARCYEEALKEAGYKP